MEKNTKATLVVIGGGEDKQADKKILHKIVQLSGKDQAKIGVITTATKYPQEVGREYERLFYDLNAKEVHVIPIIDRKGANIRKNLDRILDYDCLFFTGGDQLRISSIIGGTYFHHLIHTFYNQEKVIAGTSAGASMMSEVMIVEGDDEEAPRKCTIKLAPGMGLIENVIIDQHFNQRGRIGRLLAAVAQNPNIIGIGIDEDTALIVEKHTSFTVMGKGVVTLIDGRNMDYTNISQQHPDQSLALTNVTLHILPENYGYDFTKKMAIIKKN